MGNDFRVLRLLKEGGMAVVYVAEQVSLQETRALKFMRQEIPGLESPERREKYRARFLEEALKSRGIRSAHVVKIVAAGVDVATDTPWLAMELLTGEDLDARLRRCGRLTWEETRTLLEQLGHGLGAAHRQGVLHLDLKPDNLFVAEPESPGVPFTVKVLDFGIGRVVDEQRAAVTATTAVGSPLWMAPEQTLRQEVSAATDLWPVGLIVYRCLTGHHYWREAAKSEDTFSPTGWILEMMTGELDPASSRARESGVEVRLPPGFDGWFARCVSRDRIARWQSVDEMLRAFFSLPPPTSTLEPATAATRLSATVAWTTPTTLGAPNVAPVPTGSTVVWSAPTSALPGTPTASRRSSRWWVGIVLAVAALASAVALAARQRGVAGDPSRSTTAPAPPFPAPAVVASPIATAVVPDSGREVSPAAALHCPGTMVLIPGGHVDQPTSNASDAGVERIEVRPFCLMTREVSVAQYRECVDLGACTPGGSGTGCNARRSGRTSAPMNCVDPQQAEMLCAWLVGRLPTDAEWEIAAHGGGRTYPWGEIPATDQPCWSGLTELSRTCAIAGSPDDVTPGGVFDLSGNVSEWVSGTCRFLDQGQVRFERAAGATGHLYRGGSYTTTDTGQIAQRQCLEPAVAADWVGFRCAASPTVEGSDAGSNDSP